MNDKELEFVAAMLRQLAAKLETVKLETIEKPDKQQARLNDVASFAQNLYKTGESTAQIHARLDKQGYHVSRRTVERWIKTARDNEKDAS